MTKSQFIQTLKSYEKLLLTDYDKALKEVVDLLLSCFPNEDIKFYNVDVQIREKDYKMMHEVEKINSELKKYDLKLLVKYDNFKSTHESHNITYSLVTQCIIQTFNSSSIKEFEYKYDDTNIESAIKIKEKEIYTTFKNIDSYIPKTIKLKYLLKKRVFRIKPYMDCKRCSPWTFISNAL
ncbi:MAG: hypothetical protein ACPGUI_00515 [Halarcobacter sp.]